MSTTQDRWNSLRSQLTIRRKQLGVHQEDVAEHARLGSRATIGRVERGETVPGVETFIAHAAALDLEVALVPGHLARLLDLSTTDIVTLIRAARAASIHQRVPEAQRPHLLEVLMRLNPPRVRGR